LSSPAWGWAWHFLAKWFYGSGLAAAVNAVRCSGSVSIAIADSAIAALLVGRQHDFSSVVAPTAGISAVRRADWTIGTGSGSIGAVIPDRIFEPA